MDALGLVEVRGFSPAMVALDVMTKTADVRILQAELNDLYGVCLKITGETAAVQAAIAAGKSVVDTMHVEFVADIITAPDRAARRAYEADREFSPLIEQDVVHVPGETMSEQAPFA